MENIEPILRDYIENVETACSSLLKSINRSENIDLKTKYDFFAYRAGCKKLEFETEEMKYILHGVGCMAFSEKMFLNWDFGYRSRWCGIEPWKVSMTLKRNGSIYREYYDGNAVKESCEQLAAKGKMFKKNNQYYFEIARSETFKPSFPSEYDTLVIEHSGTRWIVPRNKVIDRFIRKSAWIYNGIEKNENRYILRFFLKEKEVYAIPYDDTGYPENAIKIMSDEILKHLSGI